MAIKALGHTFNINDISLRLIPEPRNTFNEFDAFGLLLGLERLPVESNASYKKRLLDVNVHKANSTYTGLVNGITRELGLEFFNPVTLTVRSDVDDTYVPGIEFKDNKVFVYQNILTKELELELDRNDPSGYIYSLSNLVDYINSDSIIYQAELLDDSVGYKRTDMILNSTSVPLVLAETVPTSSSFTLNNKLILNGTISFSESTVFRTEVNTEANVNSSGRYYIDYTTGRIVSFSTPLPGTLVRYKYHKEPFSPTASPVIIRALYSEEFKERLFNQILGLDGQTVHGAPTQFGADVINELLSVCPVYYGE